MKKLLSVLFILFLVACEEQEIVVEDLISNELQITQNFTVEEYFEFSQYGKNGDLPDSLIIDTENEILYQRGQVYSYTNTVIERNYLEEESREIYEYESFINPYQNNAYLKSEDDWYELELTKLFMHELGSIDPVAIINSILFDNENVYYKSEQGITGNAEDYRYVVAELSSDTFEDLFESTIFNHVDVQYDYYVDATLRFNDEYQVVSIEFNLNNLLSQMKDYRTYELKSDISSLSASYELRFRDINSTVFPKIEGVIDWNFTDNQNQLIGYENAVFESNELHNFNSLLTYVIEESKYQISTTIRPTEEYQYLYYELYFFKEDQLLGTHQSEYYHVQEDEELLLYYAQDVPVYDELIVTSRYIIDGTSIIQNDVVKIEVEKDDVFEDNYIDISMFTKEFTNVVPYTVIEHKGLLLGKDQYSIELSLLSKVDVENLDIEIYVYDEGLAKDVIEFDDIALMEDEIFCNTFTLTYLPDEIYINLNYNTSDVVRTTEKLIPIRVLVGLELNEAIYREPSTLSFEEVFQPSWNQYRYLIKGAGVGLVYFVDNNFEIVGVELMNITSDGSWSNLYEDVAFIYMDQLVDEQIVKINIVEETE